MKPLLAVLLLGASLTGAAVDAREALGAEPNSDRPSADQRRAAQKTFEAADELYEVGQYAEALTTYRASYALVASPNSLLMIARSLRELGRFTEAYLEFRRTRLSSEASGGRYAQTALAARDEEAVLRSRIGLLRLELGGAPPTTTLLLDGQALAHADLAAPIPLTPGAHHLEAQARERRFEKDFSVEAGAELELVVSGLEEPRPAPAARPPARAVTPRPAPAKTEARSSAPALRTGAWLASGIGLAGMGAFGVFGLLNNAQYADLEKPCTTNACRAARPDDIDTGKRYQLFANVGLVVGLAGLGTGAALFVLSSGKNDEPKLTAGVGPGSVTLLGTF